MGYWVGPCEAGGPACKLVRRIGRLDGSMGTRLAMNWLEFNRDPRAAKVIRPMGSQRQTEIWAGGYCLVRQFSARGN